jgi:eukaryotic-like serine/threonine-protein kinase
MPIPAALNNLGLLLANQGILEEATTAYRRSLRLKPDDAVVHCNIGAALKKQGKLDEAIAEEREALWLKPDYAEAHRNLGVVFGMQHRYADALSELKTGHELGSKNPNWRYPSAEWLRATERLLELERKLAALAAETKATDATEAIDLAGICYDKKLYAASARFWCEAFQAQPKLADDMQAQHRYNAACAAALAGAGQGKDDPRLDKKTKTRWRKQSIVWLNADLKTWSKLSESAPPQPRRSIPQTLLHWKADQDLASLRDPSALAKVPADEQKACQALWSDVNALLAKIAPKPSPWRPPKAQPRRSGFSLTSVQKSRRKRFNSFF